MGKFVNAEQLKEEIAKESVWASLSVIEIIDELVESQTIFYPQVDGITPIVICTSDEQNISAQKEVNNENH